MPDVKSLSPAQLWLGRVSSAYQLWRKKGKPQADLLEDSLAGIFPICVKGAKALDGSTSTWAGAGSDQVNYNLNLGAVQFMLAQSWDKFPSLTLASKPMNASEDLIAANERIAQILCDEADASEESRIAMESAMTRGPFVLWYGVGAEVPTAEAVNVMSSSAGDVVERLLQGEEVELVPGMDFIAIAAACRALAGDVVQAAALGLKGVGVLLHAAQQCDLMDEKEKKAPKTVYERAKPWVQALPVGTWCVWDASVTDVRKAGWIARKIIYDEEEFQAFDGFTDKAKRECKAVKGAFTEGWAGTTASNMSEGDDAYENARYIVWHIIDKRHLKQHYVAEGYDGFLEKDDTYPFLNEYQRPVLPSVFPCVIRTPIRTVREKPESSWGIAQLAPGWHMQIEFIKLESETLRSIKKTARIYKAGPGVDATTFNDVKNGDDGTIVRFTQGVGDKGDEFSLLPFNAPPPSEYQGAAMRTMFRFASAVRVPAVAFTGEPVADTLGQEQIAVSGASTTQADIIRQYESAYAEMAWGLLQLFRAYAPDEQVQAYLGADCTTPRQEPVIGPDGQPMLDPTTGMPQMKALPSLWEEWKSVSLDGHKFEARFASSTRAEDAVQIKQAQDYLALSRNGLNSLGIRMWDEADIMARLAKMMDQPPPKPYQPTLAEQAARAMAAGGAGMGRKPGEEGKESAAHERRPGDKKEDAREGHSDDRRAGGERGAPAVPGRQSRDRAPQSKSQMHGIQNRTVRATS